MSLLGSRDHDGASYRVAFEDFAHHGIDRATSDSTLARFLLEKGEVYARDGIVPGEDPWSPLARKGELMAPLFRPARRATSIFHRHRQAAEPSRFFSGLIIFKGPRPQVTVRHVPRDGDIKGRQAFVRLGFPAWN